MYFFVEGVRAPNFLVEGVRAPEKVENPIFNWRTDALKLTYTSNSIFNRLPQTYEFMNDWVSDFIWHTSFDLGFI